VVACEELRVFGSFERLSERVASLSPTVERLFEEVLERLEREHGATLVCQFMCALACSRHGMRADELCKLLGVWQEHQLDACLDRGRWLRLYHSVLPYLRIADGMLDFFHQQLYFAVEQRYLALEPSAPQVVSRCVDRRYQRRRANLAKPASGGGALRSSAAELALFTSTAQLLAPPLRGVEPNRLPASPLYLTTHYRVADYFLRRCDPLLDRRWTGHYARGTAELPYHQRRAGLWVELARTLSDLLFVQRKCRIGLAYDLVQDYWMCSKRMHALEQLVRMHYNEQLAASARAVLEFERFLQSRVHIFSSHPEQVFAAALSLPDRSAPSTLALSRWNSGIEQRSHLRWTNKLQHFHPCLKTFAGHDFCVRCCTENPNPDVPHVLSGADDHNLRVWDRRSGAPIATLRGHEGSVLGLCYSPQGAWIASASWDRTVRLWNGRTHAAAQLLTDHTLPVYTCAFSPSGRLLATGSQDKRVLIYRGQCNAKGKLKWNRPAQLVATLSDHTNMVSSVTFSPDGSLLATAGHSLCCHLYDVSGLEEADSVSTPSILFSTPHQQPYARDESQVAHWKPINCCRFSPNAYELVTASDDGQFIVWNLETKQGQARTEHKDGVVSIAFSPDGLLMASASHDNLIILWRTNDYSRLTRVVGHTGTVFNVEFSQHTSKYFFSSSFDRTIKMWEVPEKELPMDGHDSRLLGCKFAEQGDKLVTASRDKTLMIWDVQRGSVMGRLSGHRSNVTTCAFTDQGETVISGSRDSTLKVWDARKETELRSMDGHTGIVTAICAHPHLPLVVSTGEDKLIRVWNYHSGALLRTVYGHRASVSCCEFSRDGRRLVTGSEDHTLKLWDAGRSFKKVATLCAHTDAVMACAFTADCKRVVSGGNDRRVILWDARNALKLAVLERHTAAITAVATSADCRFFFSASVDGVVLQYDAERHNVVCSFACNSRVCTLAASPLGNQLAAGDGAGQLYLLQPVFGLNSRYHSRTVVDQVLLGNILGATAADAGSGKQQNAHAGERAKRRRRRTRRGGQHRKQAASTTSKKKAERSTKTSNRVIQQPQ